MKKIILTIVLGLVAATAVGYWYFKDLETDIEGTSQTTLMTDDTSIEKTNPEEIKGKDSIMALLKLGKSMECTFYFNGNDMKGEGTGYFYQNKSRVDSLYSGQGESTMASYMITDGATNMMYSWFLNAGKLSGIKMAIPEDTADTAQLSASPAQATLPQVTPDTDVNYDCKPWTVDNSVFVPPSDVEFMDMTNMKKQMEAMQQGMGSLDYSDQ